jgi:hypothetical protein
VCDGRLATSFVFRDYSLEFRPPFIRTTAVMLILFSDNDLEEGGGERDGPENKRIIGCGNLSLSPRTMGDLEGGSWVGGEGGAYPWQKPPLLHLLGESTTVTFAEIMSGFRMPSRAWRHMSVWNAFGTHRFRQPHKASANTRSNFFPYFYPCGWGNKQIEELNRRQSGGVLNREWLVGDVGSSGTQMEMKSPIPIFRWQLTGCWFPSVISFFLRIEISECSKGPFDLFSNSNPVGFTHRDNLRIERNWSAYDWLMLVFACDKSTVEHRTNSEIARVGLDRLWHCFVSIPADGHRRALSQLSYRVVWDLWWLRSWWSNLLGTTSCDWNGTCCWDWAKAFLNIFVSMI